MDALIYKDKNGNYYLYSYSKKQLVYINKKAIYPNSEYLNGKTIEECISLLKQEYSNNIDREIDNSNSILNMVSYLQALQSI